MPKMEYMPRVGLLWYTKNGIYAKSGTFVIFWQGIYANREYMPTVGHLWYAKNGI